MHDSAGNVDRPPLPLQKGLGIQSEEPVEEYTGPPRLEAAPESTSFEMDADSSGALIKPPPPRSDVPQPLPVSNFLSSPGGGNGDITAQTPDEALEALRNLARNDGSDSSTSGNGMSVSAVGWEEALPEDPTPAAPEPVDADDVFAELRKMADAMEPLEDVAEEIDLEPTFSTGSFSVLDRLMETPTPRPREPLPGLLRQDGTESEAAAPVMGAEKRPEVVEEEAGTAAREQEPELVAEETVPPELKQGTAAGVSHKKQTEGEQDKVVSFPSPSDRLRENRATDAKILRERGASLFNPDLYDDLISLDLEELFQKSSRRVCDAQPVIKAIREMDAKRPQTRLSMAGIGGRRVRQPNGFKPIGGWRDCVPTPGATLLAAEDGGALDIAAAKASAEALDTALPAGILESMGIRPQNGTGRLVRSELFNKEPDVREFPRVTWESDRDTDVRRVYYGQQDTA